MPERDHVADDELSEAVDEALREVARLEPSPAFAHAVMKRLRAEGRRTRRGRVVAMRAALAAAATIVVLGLWIRVPRPSPGVANGPDAAVRTTAGEAAEAPAEAVIPGDTTPETITGRAARAQPPEPPQGAWIRRAEGPRLSDLEGALEIAPMGSPSSIGFEDIELPRIDPDPLTIPLLAVPPLDPAEAPAPGRLP